MQLKFDAGSFPLAGGTSAEASASGLPAKATVYAKIHEEITLRLPREGLAEPIFVGGSNGSTGHRRRLNSSGFEHLVNCSESSSESEIAVKRQAFPSTITTTHMAKRLFLTALLLALAGVPAPAAETSVPKQEEVLEWFRSTGVRWAIYTEYILSIDSAQTASLALWASKKNELNKPGFAKRHVSYLAGTMKDADRFQVRWSEAIRDVLKVPALSREEADRILGYMIERREIAKGFATEVSTLWRTEYPAAEKTKTR